MTHLHRPQYSGDPVWESRYNENVGPIDTDIKAVQVQCYTESVVSCAPYDSSIFWRAYLIRVLGGSHCSLTVLQVLAPELAAEFFESTDAANQKLIEIEVCATPSCRCSENHLSSLLQNL